MRNSYWGYWLIMLGIFVVVIMMLASDATTTNTQDYYQLKEVANSALYDSIDYSYYTQTRQIRILKEVFIENFLRRFSETIAPNDKYKIQFYDLYESPPKVSIKIATSTAGFIVGRDAGDDAITNLDVVNMIDLIVEMKGNDLSTPCDVTGCKRKVEEDSECPYYGEGTTPTGGATPITNNIATPNGGTNQNGGGTNQNGGGSNPAAGESTDENVATACSDGEFEEFDVSGLKAYAMGPVNVRENANSSSKKLKTMTGGEEVTVIGKSKTGKYWRVQYDGDKCGWVYGPYMAVNLQTYLPKNGATSVQFNITNASSSIYYADDSHTTICHRNGQCINGRQFYTGAYKPIGIYEFAKKLKNAAIQLQNSGRTLVIVDAYRPVGITYFMRDVFSDYLTANRNTQYAKDIKNFGQSWFLASNASNHNFACAVDVDIAGEEMPTQVHVLNVNAANAYYRKGAANANSLEQVMLGNGLSTIKSEWWHYQHCPNEIKNFISGGADFWNNGFA